MTATQMGTVESVNTSFYLHKILSEINGFHARWNIITTKELIEI